MYCQFTDPSILINCYLDNNRGVFSVLVIDGIINSAFEDIYINKKAEISKFNVEDWSVVDQIKIV